MRLKFCPANFRWQLLGRKRKKILFRVILSESICRCMLLLLDHILYRRAHFVRDAPCASRAVLAIMSIFGESSKQSVALIYICCGLSIYSTTVYAVSPFYFRIGPDARLRATTCLPWISNIYSLVYCSSIPSLSFPKSSICRISDVS